MILEQLRAYAIITLFGAGGGPAPGGTHFLWELKNEESRKELFCERVNFGCLVVSTWETCRFG